MGSKCNIEKLNFLVHANHINEVISMACKGRADKKEMGMNVYDEDKSD
jgi:hypothetical protein